jgi:hypothetical protein
LPLLQRRRSGWLVSLWCTCSPPFDIGSDPVTVVATGTAPFPNITRNRDTLFTGTSTYFRPCRLRNYLNALSAAHWAVESDASAHSLLPAVYCIHLNSAEGAAGIT